MPNTISLQEISEPNAAWGICGFVSSIGALCYEGRLTLKVPNNYLNSILIWAIREYLHHLLKDGSPLVQKIETFTAGFTNAEGKQPYESFTVRNFVERIWAVKAGNRSFGIAMPPDGVVDFLIYHG